MGDLWRSVEMQQVQLFVQIEAARDTVEELGNLGIIQFRDLNPDVNAFQRTFVAEVKRFDDMERKVRYFEDQLKKTEINPSSLAGVQVEPINAQQSSKVMIDELESKFDELEKELVQMNTNQETLDRNSNELIELQYVLEKDAWFFDESDIQRANEDETKLGGGDDQAPLLNETGKQSAGLGFLTGVILRDKIPGFERVLWRATRGNMFLKQTPIDTPIKDPHTGENVDKNVFIVFYQGARAQTKIKKICESFGANIYTCPETVQARNELRNQVRARLDDLRVVLLRTKEHSTRVMLRVAANLENWKTVVIKEKAIFHTMNMFNYDLGRKCLIAEGWCPITATEEIQLALRRATERSGAAVPSILSVINSKDTPPTFHKTTKFTDGFQNIVDAYGIASYREINPTVFTIVTFPFLFGVMFGDVGHGLFLGAFSLSLILMERYFLSQKKLDEMVAMVFGGRYLLLLMSLFAIYCGFIYNEFFNLPMRIFGSGQWVYPVDNSLGIPNATASAPIFPPNNTAPYYFGVDMDWKTASNELDFYNSLKKKTSIILGVTQMLLGIIISAINAINFRKPYDFLFVFIPQMVFMLSTFGYLCFLVIMKWFINFPADGRVAPSLLNLMIGMFLSPLSPEVNKTVDVYYKNGTLESTHSGNYYMFEGQMYVQITLVVLAIISIPIMLLFKPLLLRRDHNKQLSQNAFQHVHEDDGEARTSTGADSHGGGGGHGDGEFDFSEELVHQAIHTIEFVIGAVSNTASYLRLWALSLAHSELAAVFLTQVLVRVLSMQVPFFPDSVQFILLWAAFAVWAFLTVAVLLMMESLSAFLHALRLHWVEFQNKFYQGDGYKFTPFSFKTILDEQL